MRGRRHVSLRARLALVTAGAVAVAVVLVCGGGWLLARAQMVRQIDSQLRSQSNVVARLPQLLQQLGRGNTPPAVPEAVPVRVQIVTAREILSAPDQPRLPVDGRDRDVAAGRRGTLVRTVTVDGKRYRLLSRRAPDGTLLQLGRPLDDVESTLDRLALLLGLVGLAGVAGAALAGRLLARAGLAPVTRAAAAAEHVARTTDLRAAVPVEGDDEVARLARSLNAMLAALDGARRQQQQLVEDAGHELRTPLTSLRANVELLLREERSTQRLPAEEREALLADIRDQLAELGHLVNELVDLAREDAAPEAVSDVDMAALVAEAAARTRRNHPGVRIDVRSQAVRLCGRRNALERAVGNLLDNAAKFGPPGGSVDVRVSGDRERVTVEVADRGSGVPELDRAKVFERFYRAQHARAVPGSGLGLAIVRQAVEAHQGDVALEPRPGGGTVARMVLPVGDLSRTP